MVFDAVFAFCIAGDFCVPPYNPNITCLNYPTQTQLMDYFTTCLKNAIIGGLAQNFTYPPDHGVPDSVGVIAKVNIRHTINI
jgi:hypothetical protein